MPAAPLPIDEADRLQTLKDYQILDTLPEREYDDIVGIASRICNAPIALVSLVDADRQWFKARQGVDVAETGRDAAFCAHAILDKHNVLFVSDASKDSRFCDNPLVTNAPHIRLYAGSPLVSPSGHALGTLCVIDSEARELSSDQLTSLEALARQATSLLELRGRTRQLEQCRVNLELSNEALGDFAYAASHDLQQPIRGIGSLTEFFIEDFGSQIDEKATDRLRMIQRLSQRSQKMLQQMLHYARVGSLVGRHQAINLNETVEQVKENLFTETSLPNVNVEVLDLPEVTGEPVLINELFQNLISNGIKYNDSCSKTITVGHQRKRIGEANSFVDAFFVADNGIGIPEKMRSDVFTIFRRLQNADAYGGGSGAGLTISKKIVEKHGGKLWIDPSYDCGTCFWFTLNHVQGDLEDHFIYGQNSHELCTS